MKRPVSATHGAVAGAGLLAFLLAVVFIRLTRPFGENMVTSALFVMGVTAVAIIFMDLTWQRVYLRVSTGIDWKIDHPSWPRTLLKCAGLLGSMGFVAMLYWLFPEYHGEFYDRYFVMLREVLPVWLLLALPYFYLVDRHMSKPQDGYWHVGKFIFLRWREIDWRVMGQHLLGWLIKGFFLPLMFTYMCNDLNRMVEFDFDGLNAFEHWFDFLQSLFYFIDVGMVAMGYLVSLRLTDTHLRSAEPTMLGWMVALLCYEPFFSLFGRQYLSYETGYQWGAWLWDTPVIYGIWGTVILLLTAIYVWATVIFGARFSNLTHRGIITNGPYRWTKHPAYLSKNLSWWMISIPFMALGSADVALRHCLLLLALNGIYLLRAKTEEWHLSRDPLYVEYALWMENHGILRWMQGWPVIRQLVYHAPEPSEN